MIYGHFTELLLYLLGVSWALFIYVVTNFYVPIDYVEEILEVLRNEKDS